MKKHLFLLALGATALAGCTSTEVNVEGPLSNAIGFTNVVNKPNRGAYEGDLTNTTFTDFWVYGYYTQPGKATPIQIFMGVPVHKDNNKWTYNGTRYWIPGCTYYFYAYSCADIALANGNGTPSFSLFDDTNPSVDDRALSILQYVCDSNHQHDLVTAESENIVALEKGNPDVSLAFSHALCKVKANFNTDFPEGYKVYISKAYLSYFYNIADFNVGTGSWTNYKRDMNNPATVSLNLPNNAYVENKADSEVETTDAFIIPKLYDTKGSENVRLHFTIKVTKPTETGEATILERALFGTWSPQWVKGNVYRYNINITGSSAGIEPIVFAAEQSLSGSSGSWENATQVNMVFGVDTEPAPANVE